MKRIVYVLFMVCGFVASSQQISTFVSNDQIIVGQPDTLTIKIGSSIENVTLPIFQDTLSSKLEVLHVSKVDSTTNGNEFQFIQQLYFTSFDTGLMVVPPVAFIVNDSTIYSQPALVYVVGEVVDLAKNIHGIQDIEEAPITMKEVLVVVGKVVLLVVIILLVMWLIRRFYLKYKLSKETAVVLEPQIPFMDTFWDRLSKIEEGKFWQKGEVKKFHSLVTSLMRSYLEYRYGISAMEQTSDEILTQLQILVQDKILFAKIEQTLRFADMVKFAKAVGVKGQHEKAIDNLKELVQLTDFKPTEKSE